MTNQHSPNRRYVKLLRIVDIGQHFRTPLPKQLSDDYDIPADSWRGMARRPQKKYLNRRKNIRRAMNRVSLFLPELMSGQPQRVLELSTAHGALLEVLRYYGHDVIGNDYVNMVSGENNAERALYRGINDTKFSRDFDDFGLAIPRDGGVMDWPYRPIIESIGIPMKLFDAGVTPYPAETGSFDYIISMQAIEHYCHPKDWLKVVEEMCRISRRCVFLLLNPMMPELAEDTHYSSAFQTAREELRDYDRNGFRCVGCHLHWGQALGFKLMSL
ncbi:class I SAM-dependent methyltransferase [Sinirhodobacter sp. WL0062]|uniref:Class I SAM-dependent methyltransferase n=1 Tax=Rhodobacter flavimaris TaxID=2907145 RepID=A0ABS8YS64_9RHOB|nr:class I SAM-dependent methyltransferase [Sinirhodobacter sp. WL0062]MCE5972293.1 class I SAM-dependent methyltransferase [Sinirhodobacter sp. WL0062]